MTISLKNTDILIFLVFFSSAMFFSIFKIEYPLFVFAGTLPFLAVQKHLLTTFISDIKKLRYPLIFSAVLTFFAFVSLIYCFDISKTLASIFYFWLIPQFIMVISFLVFLRSNFNPTKISILILGVILFAHIVATIIQWILFGYSRNAGLAMGQTPIIPYSIFLTLGLCYSICLFYFTKYKKIAFSLSILSVISFYANGSRCLIFVVLSLILFSLILFKYAKKGLILVLSLIIICGILSSTLILSHQWSIRFNFNAIFANVFKILQYTPSSMGQYDPYCFSQDSSYSCAKESRVQKREKVLDPSFLNRLSLYKSASLIIIDNPLRPNGYNQHYFKYNIPHNINPSSLPYPRDKDGLSYYGEIHNSFLSAFFEMGIIGGLAYMLFFAYLFVIGIKKQSFFSMLLSMFVLSISIISIFDIPLGSGTTACFSFFIFGMCLGIMHRKDLQ